MKWIENDLRMTLVLKKMYGLSAFIRFNIALKVVKALHYPCPKTQTEARKITWLQDLHWRESYKSCTCTMTCLPMQNQHQKSMQIVLWFVCMYEEIINELYSVDYLVVADKLIQSIKKYYYYSVLCQIHVMPAVWQQIYEAMEYYARS